MTPDTYKYRMIAEYLEARTYRKVKAKHDKKLPSSTKIKRELESQVYLLPQDGYLL